MSRRTSGGCLTKIITITTVATPTTSDSHHQEPMSISASISLDPQPTTGTRGVTQAVPFPVRPVDVRRRFDRPEAELVRSRLSGNERE